MNDLWVCVCDLIYSISALLPISVSVQVSERLLVREFDLRRMVDWRSDKLEHGFLHICKGEIGEKINLRPHGSTWHDVWVLTTVTHWVCGERYQWQIRPTDTGRRPGLQVLCDPDTSCRSPWSWMFDRPESGWGGGTT